MSIADHARLGRAIYRLLQRFTDDPEVLSLAGSIGDTLEDGEIADMIDDYLETGEYMRAPS